MSSIFYFFSSLFVVHDFIKIINFKSTVKKYRTIKDVNGDQLSFEDKVTLIKDNKLVPFIIIEYLYLIWLAFGLIVYGPFFAFLSILMLSIINQSKNYLLILNSVVSISIILFIVYNKYFLHYNIDLIVKNFFINLF